MRWREGRVERGIVGRFEGGVERGSVSGYG